MSKKGPTLEPERVETVLAELVDMYIEKGGGFPTTRDIKKNPYITEEEVAILRRNHQLDERFIRTMAEQKTGRKYKSQRELNKERNKAATIKRAEDNRDKISRGIVAAAKRAEQKKVEQKIEPIQEVKKVSRTKVDGEKLREVLRGFATKNLRWPTDVEIRKYREEGIVGWASSAEINRRFGARDKWAAQIFPEGLPEGFVPSKKGGFRSTAPTPAPVKESMPAAFAPASAPVSTPASTPVPVPVNEPPAGTKAEESITAGEFAERIDKLHSMLTEHTLPDLISMSTGFQMESRFCCKDYCGKKISLTFKVE